MTETSVTSTPYSRHFLFERVPGLCGALGLLSCASVLAGWAFDIETLKRLRPEWPPQSPLAAATVGVIGLALVLRSRTRWPSFVLGGIVAVLQGFKLVAVYRNVPSFADHLLFASKVSTHIASSPNTWACLFFLGTATLCLSGVLKGVAAVGRIFAAGAAVIALVALTGYLGIAVGFDQIGGNIPVRLQTGVVSVILAVGLVCVADPSERFSTKFREGRLPVSAGLFATTFTLLVLILAASFWGERQADATADLAFTIKSRELEDAQILSTLQDAEIGQRGYLLTGDEAFLAPYDKAIADAELLRSELSDLARAGGSPAVQIATLQDLIARRLALLAQTVDLAKSNRRDEAVALERTAQGKSMMDDIRSIIAAIEESQNGVLNAQIAERNKISEIVKMTEIAGMVLLLIAGATVLRQIQLTLAAQTHARDAAYSANRAKSAFLASMSHELRTPMTGIIGMCDLLLMGDQSAEDRQITRILARSAQTLLGLLNDILDLSKIEAGRLALESVDFRLSAIFSEASHLFGPIASKKGLVLNIDRAIVGQDVFRGDPKRLQQILFNLIGNAVKFTERGSITVRQIQSRNPDRATALTLEVADTGIGIGEAARSRLFREFEQEDMSTSRKYGGSGLGLSICRRLAEAMGGTIGVESEKGKGSRFFVSLSLPDGDAASVVERTVGDASSASEKLKGLNLDILLAEDTPATQHLITTMLSRWGHQVTAVSDGEQAVAAARSRAWDIILMDMQMPVMDGSQAMRIIRGSEGPAMHVPIIALTADALSENHRGYLDAGATVVATKPIHWSTLAQQIASLIDPLRRNADPSSAKTVSADTASLHEAPVFDRAILDEMEQVIGTGAIVALIETALASLPQDLIALRTAAQARDLIAVKRSAHKLRGLAAQYGALRTSVLATLLEEAPARADHEAIERLAGSVEEAAAALHQFSLERSRAAVPVS